jgi:hypothetical protein
MGTESVAVVVGIVGAEFLAGLALEALFRGCREEGRGTSGYGAERPRAAELMRLGGIVMTLVTCRM